MVSQKDEGPALYKSSPSQVRILVEGPATADNLLTGWYQLSIPNRIARILLTTSGNVDI